MKQAHDCNYKVNSDGILNNYTVDGNCSCTFCDAACVAPAVNGDVGFFDGCDGLLVGLIWAYLILFSIVLAVFRNYYEKKRIEAHKKKMEEEAKKKESERSSGKRMHEKINESGNISNFLS